jgi:hypothetical protein
VAPIFPALQAVQVWLKSVSAEGNFTREAETAFCPYFASHCSGLIQTSCVAATAHWLQEVQVGLKPVINEGHFIREVENFSSLSRLTFQRYDGNITSYSLTSACLVKISQ